MPERRVAVYVLTSEERASKLRGAFDEFVDSERDFFDVKYEEDEGFEQLAEAMMPTSVPSKAFVEQVRRNVSERVQFLQTYGAFTADQVAEAVGSRATNRRSLAARWRAEQKIFAVRVPPNTLVYPAFQFDFEGQPLPIIGDVLAALPEGLRDGGWQLALWWDTPTELLGYNRPADLLLKDPEGLVSAARAEAEEWAQADPSLTE
ncbi:MAG: hypothetical protein ACLPVY_10455 [Acidimicrobiia bacterium]